MSFRQLVELLSWDIRVNIGPSLDSIRAVLLLVELRIEQYIYRNCKASPARRYIWYAFRFAGSILDIIPIYGSMCLDRQGGYTCDCDMRTSETKRIESWI